MKPANTVSRFVFYPVIFAFGAVCWYLGYSQGQGSIPIGFEAIELPICMPEQVEHIRT